MDSESSMPAIRYQKTRWANWVDLRDLSSRKSFSSCLSEEIAETYLLSSSVMVPGPSGLVSKS